MPRCNVKFPLHIWDSQNGCFIVIDSIGVYAIHGHAFLVVVINSTVSIFHQSIGNDMFFPVQVHKLLEGESSPPPIIREAMQLDLELGGHFSDILRTKK